MDELVVIFITTESAAQAEKVALALLEPRLAACVNVVPSVISRYWWQGQLETSAETFLVVKTRRCLVDAVTQAVQAAHSYSVPEVIALPMLGGNPEYLDWVRAETAPACPDAWPL